MSSKHPHIISRTSSIFLGDSYYHSYGGDDSGTVIRFSNVRILRKGELIKEDLWIQHGRIIDPQMRFFKLKKGADITIDGKNCIISPGYIDVQLNGGFGLDFSTPKDIEEGAVQKVAKELLQHGVTSFCPTIITSESSTYKKIIPKIIPTRGSANGAEVIGLHLEGPFISSGKYGAHKKEFIQTEMKDVKMVENVYGQLENVRIITVAPELPGVIDTIPSLVDRGICVSAGHSMATIEISQKAVEKGITLITHLFNAMVPFHHRDPGLIGLLDEVHSHHSSVKIAYKSYPKGFVLITDAIGAMGLPEGSDVQLGTMKVTISKGKAYISGTETLAGSIVTMDAAVRNFWASTGCSIVEALEAATLHPAKALGMENFKGTLDFGSDADFLLLDEKLNVEATFIDGQLGWSKSDLLDLSQIIKMSK